MKRIYTLMASAIFLFASQQNLQAQCNYTVSTADSVLCDGDSTLLYVQGAQNTLVTTLSSGNNHRGNMFSIVAANTVIVTGFDAHPQGNTTIEVYYRAGDYIGFETSSVGWTLAGSSAVVAQPLGTATPVPVYVGVTIPAGQTYSFYVTSTDISVSLNYTDGTGEGNVWSSDANISFLEGKGMEYPFTAGGGTFSPRVWNGNIHYELPLDYLWNTGDTTSSIMVSPTTSASYGVTVNDILNGCSNSDSIDVVVNALPVVNLFGDSSLCVGDSIIFDAGSASSYLWNTGDTTQTISIPGADTVFVELIDANGCIGSDTSIVTSISHTIDLGVDTTACDGTIISLNAGVGTSFNWSTTDSTQLIDVSTGGTYSVVSTGTNGCSAYDTIVVNFLASPIVQLLGDTTLCDGTTLVLDAMNIGDSTVWNTGDTTQTISVNNAGTYSVIVVSANGCSSSDDIVVSTSLTPVATFTSTNTLLLTDFTDLSTDATSWSWDFGDGNTSSIQDPTNVYSTDGTYTVTLIAYGPCGSDTTTMDVTVNSVGLDESVLDQNINVYPNPTNGQFTLELNSIIGDNVTVQIVDIRGSVLYSKSGELQNSYKLNLENQLMNGLYFINITVDEITVSKRMVIRK